MVSPRITVVIPTRERHEVLEKALQTVVDQDYDNLEIIVSDNYSSDATADVVRGVRDERVRHLNTGRRLSMTHNWEFALSHVGEGWVTVMGDDDGLLPGSVAKLATVVTASSVEAVRSAVCSYSWPSLLGTENGHLAVPLRTGSQLRDAAHWLEKVLRGTAGYADLPMLYTGGYVHTAVLERIKRASGAVYRSRIPDVYSAVAVASSIDRYLYLHEPLGINGASQHSTGTSEFAKDKPRSSPSKLFASEPNIPFHEDLPLCPDGSTPRSIQALVYESYLQSVALRPRRHSGDMRAEQLALILAGPGGHEASIVEWGKCFAAQHGLDFASVQAKVAARRRATQAKRAWQRLSTYLNSDTLCDPRRPIKDVHQAALAAAAIRATGPRRIKNAAALLLRLARTGLGR
jgi:hypothetical protein